MGKINNAIHTFCTIDELSRRKSRINNLNPLIKLCFLIVYLTYLMSRGKYDLYAVIILTAFPIVVFLISDLSFKDALMRLKLIIPFIVLMGTADFFTNKGSILINDVPFPAQAVSAAVLTLKGMCALFSSYAFAAVTQIERLCDSLKRIHLPVILITVIMLTYRYILLLLEETDKITTAYTLRAPGQKGINFKVWGSLAGQMLLRTLERGEALHESMKLRGYE